MQRLRVALLDASHGTEHTPRNFRREVDGELVRYDASAGDIPDAWDVDAAIVTGSRASVYWDEPWIDALLDWTAEAVDRGLPLLGVCFGHQVLAEALGGEVAAMDDYEIGYRTIEHDGGRLFDGVDGEFTAFTTHSDEVVTPPPGAKVLAANDRSLHAFRLEHAFGVQFHPEYDRETATSVTRGKDELADDRVEAVLDGITEANYRAACEAKTVFENFCSYAREVRAPAR